MASAPDQDFRNASEAELLAAIGHGHALALAEAYHRLIPAAHAVARRLMGGAAEVEEVIEEVFAQLWEQPPQAAPLGGWIRRTTWAAGAERLRAGGIAPASPSASGLLPDLPAPDVRFLDAAERAIAELPDDERRALLLAHDKGVSSPAQEAGAADALVRALLALAGPETSAGDRAALHEDGCADLPEVGDWCLDIAEPATGEAVETAIEQRPGCAAKSRAVRRGRRRIEGLPATPDMGQRVLVKVLTTGSKAAVSAATAAPAAEQDPGAAADMPADDEVLTDQPISERADAREEDVPGIVGPLNVDVPAAGLPEEAEDSHTPVQDLDAEDAGPVQEEPAADPVETAGAAAMSSAAADPLMDTADLPAADDDGSPDTAPSEEAAADAEPPARELDPDHEQWAPTPGDTAELRLSDILAEDEDPDDPFAELDAPEPEPEPQPAGTSPYSALQDLSGEGEPAAGSPFGVAHERQQGAAPDVYIEGQDHGQTAPAPARRRNPMAALLSWLLPILGGAAVGIIIAAQVFGAPGGS